MLALTCDYCGRTFEAEVSNVQYPQGIMYMDGNKRHHIQSPDKPCKTCDTASETAKRDALQAIKEKSKSL